MALPTVRRRWLVGRRAFATGFVLLGCDGELPVERCQAREDCESEQSCMLDGAGDGRCVNEVLDPWRGPTLRHLPRRAKVDLLFVVDNGPQSVPVQARLLASAEALVGVLEDPLAPLDYRIAVTNSSGHGACPDPGVLGALTATSCHERSASSVPGGRQLCEAWCSQPALQLAESPIEGDSTLRARPWIERTEASNLAPDADVLDTLRCMLVQAPEACPQRNVLSAGQAAIARATSDADAAYGFRRNDAQLVVVYVSAQDDCTPTEDGLRAFDPGGERTLWTDPDAEVPTAAVCWNAMADCQGSTPDHLRCLAADIDERGELTEDAADAVLRAVRDLRIKDAQDALYGVREIAIVGVDAGDPDGVALVTQGQDPAFTRDHGADPICGDGDLAAAPALRLRSTAAERWSVCDPDYAAALRDTTTEVSGTWDERWICPAVADPGTCEVVASFGPTAPWAAVPSCSPSGSTEIPPELPPDDTHCAHISEPTEMPFGKANVVRFLRRAGTRDPAYEVRCPARELGEEG